MIRLSMTAVWQTWSSKRRTAELPRMKSGILTASCMQRTWSGCWHRRLCDLLQECVCFSYRLDPTDVCSPRTRLACRALDWFAPTLQADPTITHIYL